MPKTSSFSPAPLLLCTPAASTIFSFLSDILSIILELLEREGIDSLYIELETDPERNKREQKAANN
ncbi:MAG: hypothetical protein HWQ44_00115 [Nostoc sp. JL34]|uniref:hypothetical protein n=1 Tax=Nostoc sp. JL34 TaxID=2815397 RepID=UPI001DDB01F2|nr:hypothetical protein [Nostoc sp. JL34]MBN3881419.1 hypothetical protein [Nostoc sp. JL34]